MTPPGELLPSVESWVEKQVTRTTAAGEAWKEGVKNPRRDPVAQAKKSNTKYKNAVQAALASDKWLRSLDKIDPNQVAATVEALGAGVFTQGVSARRGKIAAAIGKLRPLLLTHMTANDAMPGDTPEQREAKMIANLRGMRSIGAKLRGM